MREKRHHKVCSNKIMSDLGVQRKTLIPSGHDQNTLLEEQVSKLSLNHKYQFIRHLRGWIVLESKDTTYKGMRQNGLRMLGEL